MLQRFSRNSFQVKAAFTRTYNKEAVKKPYAVITAAKKGKGAAAVLNEYEEQEDNAVSESDEDDSVTSDAMIKVNKF